ncbi:hypothetical protein QEH52_08490 [Coraliomargarita sp. SDUM461003]|uniref:Tetratricopeptide repeat protein n=1 Tax=Thalassobacterium maritimum TaxID=3041265 RepID=A0ABU1ATQ3_9BACT|nr:hypothetical protein [Coraliomargarita sp. SDUM461003]MDQ8207544.1 hypothetical protein [Coraliomargarita sp. SDUM461003]
MLIDIETGIVTRANQSSYTSLNALMKDAGRAAYDLTQTHYDSPAQLNVSEKLNERLRAEGRLYYKLATNDEWDKKWTSNGNDASRVEMAEIALCTIPEISDSELLTLLRRSYNLTFAMPDRLDVYRPESVGKMDNFVLNSAVDFMHLALNSRQWANPTMVAEADRLRVELLIRMNQPEEALQYLERIPRHDENYAKLLAKIHMLDGRYTEASSVLSGFEGNDLEYLELIAKAAFGTEAFKAEYKALKEYVRARGSLDHRDISERIVYLMNQFEEPKDRIRLINEYFGRWGKAMDVVQYTLARARLEVGQKGLALPVLRSLQKKKQLTGILEQNNQIIKGEIDKLLAPYEKSAVERVSYKDVALPTGGLRFYIQPIGYSDDRALRLALRMSRNFAGFDFVLLPSIRPPLHESLYDIERRQFDAYMVQQWLAGVYDAPDDALHICFLFDHDISWRGNWIYSNTLKHGWTVMSDFRWRKYYKTNSKHISRALTKVWLSVMQHPMKDWFGPDRIKEITGEPDWPNHIGTIQYSKGTAGEVFESIFTICEQTQKLYKEVVWNELVTFRQAEFENYYNENRKMIDKLIETVGLPLLSDN